MIGLWVVIAIIVILAGLLLPALSQAHSKTKQARWLSNLKRVGLSLVLDAGESKTSVQILSPLEVQFTCGGLFYSNRIVGSRPVFLCPAGLK